MNDRKKIKDRINDEIARTRELVAKYRDLSKPIAPENAIGRVSRMDAINNRSVNEAALRKELAKLHNLEIALGKIDDNDFGKCIMCKKEIPLGRILLMPHVTTCVHCAS